MKKVPKQTLLSVFLQKKGGKKWNICNVNRTNSVSYFFLKRRRLKKKESLLTEIFFLLSHTNPPRPPVHVFTSGRVTSERKGTSCLV